MRARLLSSALSAGLLGAGLVVVPLSLATPAHATEPTFGSSAGSRAEYELHDTFDNAVNTSPHYGLNSRLVQRQEGSAGAVGYTRESGHWSSTSTFSNATQVNHSQFTGKMSFHTVSGGLPTSAVKLDAPLAPAYENAGTVLRVAANGVSPLINDDDPGSSLTGCLLPQQTAGHGWVSVMLTRDTGSKGYVNSADTDFGVLVRSSGQVVLYQRGSVLVTDNSVARASSYDIEVTLRNSTSATVVVNGQTITATVSQEAEQRYFLHVGTYYDYTAPQIPDPCLGDYTTTAKSSIGELKAWRVANVQHYGHYHANFCPATNSNCADNHLAEVTGHTNFNMVSRPEHLSGCAVRECVLDVQDVFFKGGADDRALYTDPSDHYVDRWNSWVSTIGTNHNRIAAFYVIDEPYWISTRGAGAFPTQSAFEDALEAIRASYPNIPTMTVFNRSMYVPAEDSVLATGTTCPTPQTIVIDCVGGVPASDLLDWVGIMSYRPLNETGVDDDAADLVPRVAGDTSPRQRLFLVPQSHMNSDTNQITDPTMAALNQDYLDLADSLNADYASVASGKRSVVGMLTFGRWKLNGGDPVYSTAGEQYCIGHEVLDTQTVLFHDSFDDANNGASDRGLNQNLAKRQCLGSASGAASETTWVLRSGHWSSSTTDANRAQVDNSGHAGQLSFYLSSSSALSAVMLNKTLTQGDTGLRISADVVPANVTNSFVALLLSSSSTDNGYLTNGGINLGIQMKSSGLLQVVQAGTTIGSRTMTTASSYHIDATVDGDDVVIRVNDNASEELRVLLPNAVPSTTYLYVENYWPGTSTVSYATVDNVLVAKRKL